MDNDVIKLVNECELNLREEFKKIDEIEYYNSMKVINSFWNNNVSEYHFNDSSGYGYSDIGRDVFEKVFSEFYGAEASLVRSQFISGTHAIQTALFGVLRPNDKLLFISGVPYDTIKPVIGINDNPSSLKSFGINYDIIELINNDFDYESIKAYLDEYEVKMIYIQRSRGYTLRDAIDIESLERVIKFIKNINNNIIVFVDNCYCENTEMKTPIEVGADITAGSLIKNLGAGIAPFGGYITGKKKLVDLCADRLNVVGQSLGVGPQIGMNKIFFKSLYHSPSVVASSLKIGILTSMVLEKLGYKVSPRYNERKVDIVTSIYFNNEKELISFARYLQNSGAIDSSAVVEEVEMPGYECDILMASPSFISGSSIELSCDAPVREPYVLYMQGGLTYTYGKIALIKILSGLKKDGLLTLGGNDD